MKRTERKWLVLAIVISLFAIPACDDDDDVTDIVAFDEDAMNVVLEDLIAPLLSLEVPLPVAGPSLGVAPQCTDASQVCDSGLLEVCPIDEVSGFINVAACEIDGLTLTGSPLYTVSKCLLIDLDGLEGVTEDFECVYTNVIEVCGGDYPYGALTLTIDPGGVVIDVVFDGIVTALATVVVDGDELGTCTLDLAALTSACDF